jgi:hypothetical protein
MPSYVIEVAAGEGTQRYPFTLDDDRALRPQVVQILEELRQRGVVLRGGRDDELGAYWSGRELDLSLRPAELGITTQRPLELRMRPRQEPAARGVVDHSLPRGVLASIVLGYTGGLVAWLIAGVWTDLGPARSTYLRLDQITILLLGAIAGAAVLGGAALRRRESILMAVPAGGMLGGAGAVIGASLVLLVPGVMSLRGFVLGRIAGWALAAGLASLLLACYGPRLRWPRLGESLGLGLMAGGLSGVVFALPGPSDLWQGIAFCLFGAGVGVAACGPALWRAPAIVELYRGPRLPGILSLREWAVADDESAVLESATVAARGGRAALYPSPAGAVLDGRAVTEPVYLSGTSGVTDGAAAYYVRAAADQ